VFVRHLKILKVLYWVKVLKVQNLIVCIGKSEAEVTNNTRSSAVAQGPRDASFHRIFRYIGLSLKIV